MLRLQSYLLRHICLPITPCVPTTSFVACDANAYRRHYFNNTDGLIFVVDSQDRDRLARAAQEFQAIIQDPLMLQRYVMACQVGRTL